MVEISRASYAALYGPTVGDQVRLGDTDLWIEVTEDRTVGGEEAVFGGGKSIRESMAQSTAPRPTARSTRSSPTRSCSTTGASSAPTSASGTAGSSASAAPATRTSPTACTPTSVIGPGTDVISGEGKILTAGAIDVHVHLLSRSQIAEALATGITTIGGGGTGPSEGSKATTVTPGAWHLDGVHRALDDLPVNVLLMGKGNTVSAGGSGRAGARRRRGLQGPRGLGLDARPRSTPRCGRPTSSASRSRCTPTASTRPATSSRRSPRSAGAASMPSTPKAPAAGTRRTS